MDRIEFPQEIPPGLPLKLAGSLVMHPIEVAKVLIQVRNIIETSRLQSTLPSLYHSASPPFPIPFSSLPLLPSIILTAAYYNSFIKPPPPLFRKEVSNVESNKVVLGFSNDNCLSVRYPSLLKVSTLREYLHFAYVLILPVRSQQLIRAKQRGPVQTHIAQRNFQTSAVWSA